MCSVLCSTGPSVGAVLLVWLASRVVACLSKLDAEQYCPGSRKQGVERVECQEKSIQGPISLGSNG